MQFTCHRRHRQPYKQHNTLRNKMLSFVIIPASPYAPTGRGIIFMDMEEKTAGRDGYGVGKEWTEFAVFDLAAPHLLG